MYNIDTYVFVYIFMWLLDMDCDMDMENQTGIWIWRGFPTIVFISLEVKLGFKFDELGV